MNGFVLIDRLVELEPGARVVAAKTFASADSLFRDHFPGNPLVPGSLLIEAMAQTAGWLVVVTTAFNKATQLVMVKDAKFRRAVRPDLPIELSATITASRGAVYELAADAHAAGELAASARLVLQTFDLPADDSAGVFSSWARETFRAIGGESLRREH
jgi:3-hydroxyacyl-[acyl-carrier-protein] dehydratase